jgi:hypothetical protein
VPPARQTDISTSTGGVARGRASPGGMRGAKLLLTDARVAFLLANDARYRMLERRFGIPREQANVATVVGALIAVETSQRMATRTRTVVQARRSQTPTDALLGMGAMREGMRAIAGPTAADEPLFGTLLMLAILARPARRIALRTAHGVGGSMRRLDTSFRNRYGYLVDPGHLRERRSERRRARTAAPS